MSDPVATLAELADRMRAIGETPRLIVGRFESRWAAKIFPAWSPLLGGEPIAVGFGETLREAVERALALADERRIS